MLPGTPCLVLSAELVDYSFGVSVCIDSKRTGAGVHLRLDTSRRHSQNIYLIAIRILHALTQGQIVPLCSAIERHGAFLEECTLR